MFPGEGRSLGSQLMSSRGKMRRAGFHFMAAGNAIKGSQLFQGCRQAGEVVLVAGMDQVEVKSRQRGAVENGANATDNDELHLVLVKDFENCEIVSGWCWHRGDSGETRQIAEGLAGARQE